MIEIGIKNPTVCGMKYLLIFEKVNNSVYSLKPSKCWRQEADMQNPYIFITNKHFNPAARGLRGAQFKISKYIFAKTLEK